jgi:hypothetical protein
MQSELENAPLARDVRILGVNAIGHEAGNAGISAGRTIPWLQDTDTERAWESWRVTWRDVVILDEHNRFVGVFNLTTHDLADPQNYDALKNLLEQAAGSGTR